MKNYGIIIAKECSVLTKNLDRIFISDVLRNLAKVEVEGSNSFDRSNNCVILITMKAILIFGGILILIPIVFLILVANFLIVY